MARFRFFCVVCAVLFLSACFARATQTDNHGLHAVPPPGAVAIDGKLDDWDLSGQAMMCYDIESLKDVYSARVALMYDADNLYVGIHWVDATPMGNTHNPHYQGNRGWAGDCVQLRLKTDRISHVTAWYYAANKEPAIFIDYGKDLKTPFKGVSKQLFQTDGWKLSDGAEMAFRRDEDGKGYVQEMKLPWKLITTDKQYKPGDQLNCGFELLWGEGDWPVHRYADNLSEGASGREFFFTNIPAWGLVTLEPKGNLKLPPPAYVQAMKEQATDGPVPIAYDLPEDARVTLVIDDAHGKRVRNLTPALPRTKGHNEEKWDGLDDQGKPVAPGEYQYKAIYHQPIHVNWIMSFANPGNPSWQTPDGHGAFYGDHSAAQAAAAAGDYVALACPVGEAGKAIIALNLDGKRQWGLPTRGAVLTGRITLATDGKLLWIAADTTGSVYRVNLATGKYAPWNATAKDDSGNTFQVLDVPAFDPTPEKDRKAHVNLTAMTLHDGVLALSLARTNQMQLLDADTGAKKGVLAIKNPQAAAYDSDGALIVISDGHLVRLGQDGKTTALGDTDLSNAFAVAVDAENNIYVSERGQDQNVKVFDHDGKLLREIGKRGGRPSCGPFDDNAMLNPAGIAIDSKGRLWVTEEAQNPKRTSVWNTADGRLLTDYVGTTAYSGAGSINAHDPTMAFSDNTVYKIDLATGAWRPVYSLARSNSPDDLFPPAAGSQSVVRVLQGRSYVYTAASSSVTRCMTFRDGRWRAVAAVGVVGREKDGHFQTFWHPKMAGHMGEAFTWSDLSGDGLVQPDELTIWAPPAKSKQAPVRGLYWGQLPDNNGAITFLSPAAGGLLRYSVMRWTQDGVPVYDAAHPAIIPVDFPDLGKDVGYLMGGGDGRVYINQNPLTAIGAEGKVLWTYPSDTISVHGSHHATAARPGYVIGPLTIAGVADLGGAIGEVFDMNGNLGEHYLFTGDGLFVQSLFKDTRGMFETPNQAVRGMSMDATTSGGEDFGANFIRTPDGKVYLVNGGTDARVQQVTGLETIHRLSGHFTYTPEQYTLAQQQAHEAAAKANVAKTYVIDHAEHPPTIDGKITDWPELTDESKAALDIQDSPRQRYARVAIRYDADHLYLAYRVRAHSPHLRNNGQDPRLLFKSGDCVDLMLQPDTQAPSSGMRLLISMYQDRPIAMLYEKSVEGVASKDRVPFSSPWRTIYFDRVRALPDVKIAIAPIGGGFVVEAAIPRTSLNIPLQPGMKLKGDVGVLFADSGGTITISRQYWSNKATGLVNDIPGEADLIPRLWGQFELK